MAMFASRLSLNVDGRNEGLNGGIVQFLSLSLAEKTSPYISGPCESVPSKI